ncbi:cobalamin-5'-phosphate synthase [Faunimonas pinastri]|uniref:Adenosylcobinamide-GDP ribazoletransferase n=1 Tax=Faunimonas pinastri TaxID=1855383 RepID=A0A1H9JIA6_9HYPH|nr:adenosylcobinamide-GDP ribazoletransferase [Faunimonas pinastri]SEQ86285.1 cobalamin-5'-phosphate synthase [Faunimonas pinastri]
MRETTSRLFRLPGDVRACLSFFSRLPIRTEHDRPFDLGTSIGAWPLAGVILAIVPALLLLLLRSAHMVPTIAAALTLAATAGLGGGLHEDGLSDCADGFGGGRTRGRKLEIMRDSRIGSYGALALFFTGLIRVAGLASLSLVFWEGAVALLCVAAISRAAAIWHWRALPPARDDGLAVAAGVPDRASVVIATGFGIVAAIPLLAIFGLSAILGLALLAAGVAGFTSLCRHQIAGHSGDTIGASQQIAEALLFAGLATFWPALFGG